jgi:hypothetical protein
VCENAALTDQQSQQSYPLPVFELSRLRLESLKLSLMDTKLPRADASRAKQRAQDAARGAMSDGMVPHAPVKRGVKLGAHAFFRHFGYANESAGRIGVGVEIIAHAREGGV